MPADVVELELPEQGEPLGSRVPRASGLRRRHAVQHGLHAEGHHHHMSAEELAKLRQFEALDYTTVENDLFREQNKNQTKSVVSDLARFRWFVHALIGICTGVLAFCIHLAVHELIHFRFAHAEHYVEEGAFGKAFMWFALWSIIYALVATLLVNGVEPVAAGSGIPELKGYLNGINIQRAFGWKTLVSKAVGITFSVAAGLTVGKEGPVVHSGAMIAATISHAPGLHHAMNDIRFKTFRKDREKRDFISAGAASGVAAAFGAPIGGVLFALEEASSFWSLPLTWRTFFTAA